MDYATDWFLRKTCVMLNLHHIKYYFLVFMVALADQLSKIAIRTKINENEQLIFLNGHFKILSVHNKGAFLSLGDSWPTSMRWVILILFVSILLLVLWRLMLHSSTTTKHKLCYSIIIGGGLGNLIDRIYFDGVTDFLWIGFGPLQTGVFNLADMGILFGVLYLILEPFYLKIHSKNN